MLVPLVIALPRLRDRLLATAVVLGIAAVSWLPFFVAFPSSVSARAPQVPVESGSGLIALGLHPQQALPSSFRLAQLALGCALATVLVLRGSFVAAPLAAFAARYALDPGVASYYALTPLVAVVMVDLSLPKRWSGLPTFALWVLSAATYALPGIRHWPTVPSMLQPRLTLLVGISGVALSLALPVLLQRTGACAT